MRELHYWLLRGPHGPALRALAAPEGEVRRVAAAVEVIRNRYREPIPATDVAEAANMSASALRRHFKAVTSLSPLQFQKHLRLVEARRLMFGSGLSARQAAFEVGYCQPLAVQPRLPPPVRRTAAPRRQEHRGNGGRSTARPWGERDTLSFVLSGHAHHPAWALGRVRAAAAR
nr:AraC family transcriptional regulator [Pseudoxanthomonas suwonensis]